MYITDTQETNRNQKNYWKLPTISGFPGSKLRETQKIEENLKPIWD